MPDHAHPRDAVHDLVRQALPHEAGADDADADRAPLGLALLERGVDDDHAATSMRRRTSGSTSSSGAQAASFSEMAATGSGQLEPEPRVVGGETALGVGRVELADEVARLGPVDQRLVAVGEPLRHVEGASVLLVEADGDVLEIRGALRPEVDDDVDDRAARAPDDLGLGRRRELEVHSAEGAGCAVERHVRLGDHRLQPVALELVLAERAGEVPAVVLTALEVDDEGARQRPSR